MPKQVALSILKNMDSSTAFRSRKEYIEAVAALASVFRADLHRMVGKKSTIGKILYNATSPTKCAWYFNVRYQLRRLRTASIPLLPTGTASNEALHAELKNHFAQTVRLHASTLATKLRVFHYSKLLVHTSSLLRPLQRLRQQGHLKSRIFARSYIDVAQWNEVCHRRCDRPGLAKMGCRMNSWFTRCRQRQREWMKTRRDERKLQRRCRKRTPISCKRHRVLAAYA